MSVQRWWDDFCYELKLEARQAFHSLMDASTWIMALALIAFGAEIYFGMQIAMRYDTLMQIWGMRGTRCHILTNRQYLILIYILFTFGIAMAYCLGRIVNYLSARKQNARPDEVRRQGFWALLCFLAAEAIGGVAMVLLTVWC
ncbi:MAG: hypothetical protein LBU53_10745 [Zoogloeaceae bacterium]|jgi:hypothetical protein|nr:hypothetical protein [Zoogloeaceae bacterium]